MMVNHELQLQFSDAIIHSNLSQENLRARFFLNISLSDPDPFCNNSRSIKSKNVNENAGKIEFAKRELNRRKIFPNFYEDSLIKIFIRYVLFKSVTLR